MTKDDYMPIIIYKNLYQNNKKCLNQSLSINRFY